MLFRDVVGQIEIKERLIKSVKDNKVAHTQLFLGSEGSGTFAMALAYAQYLNCHNPGPDDSCGVCPSCVKYNINSHPDLHFIMPTNTSRSQSGKPESSLFLNEWREYLKKSNNYPVDNQWFEFLGIGNKQGSINVRDAKYTISKSFLKPYEGKYKVFIIWMAEKLNMETSNKLLKTLEEPPADTIIILTAERYELLIPTVRSRTQLIKFNPVKSEFIQKALAKKLNETNAHIDLKSVAKLSKGNWNKAIEIFENENFQNEFFEEFRTWLRLCFAPGDFKKLFAFAKDLAGLGREKQKGFFEYGLSIFHNCFMFQTNNIKAVSSNGDELDFIKKFSPFINGANFEELYTLFNESIYHIERNANPGILFSDLSFKLVNLLKKGRVFVKEKQH